MILIDKEKSQNIRRRIESQIMINQITTAIVFLEVQWALTDPDRIENFSKVQQSNPIAKNKLI